MIIDISRETHRLTRKGTVQKTPWIQVWYWFTVELPSSLNRTVGSLLRSWPASRPETTAVIKASSCRPRNRNAFMKEILLE
jgi:hypothetical protein